MSKKIRLDKYLAHMKIETRRQIKAMVKAGRVLVNGEVITDSGYPVIPGEDEVVFDGERVVFQEFIYLMMNKPAGYISATRDEYNKTVLDLLPEEFRKWEVFPVGRLDKDVEGLLLLTNDGKLGHQLLSPRRHVPKTYYLKVKGEVSSQDCSRLREGVTLDDGYLTKPAEVNLLFRGEESELELTIYEGKYHQVKRMLKAVGKEVIYLKRIAMGGLKLDSRLGPGACRELTGEELARLRKTSKMGDKDDTN